jgi:hypothetical protein
MPATKPNPRKTAATRKTAKAKPRKRASRAAKPRQIVDPAWRRSKEGQSTVVGLILTKGSAIEDYYPQDYSKSIGKGAWIMVKRKSATVPEVPTLSIWYARPWAMSEGAVLGVKVKRVKILTPQGPLGLLPSEYVVIKDIDTYLQRPPSEGIRIRYTGDHAHVSSDTIHYIMSRGIARKDALLMCLKQIAIPTFLWIELHPQYSREFDLTPVTCDFSTPLDIWDTL